MGLEEKNGNSESSVEPSFDDQHFVLNFIMSTCLAPMSSLITQGAQQLRD